MATSSVPPSKLDVKDDKNTNNIIINLNVGGNKYTTYLSTLLSDNSTMLAKMFSGKYKLNQDREGYYVIDRDGKSFQYILNYLRDNDLSIFNGIPINVCEQLIKEADFYGFDKIKIKLLEIEKNYYKNELGKKGSTVDTKYEYTSTWTYAVDRFDSSSINILNKGYEPIGIPIIKKSGGANIYLWYFRRPIKS